MIVKVHLDTEEGAYMPSRGHEDDAGWDISCPIDCVIRPGEHAFINTAVHVQIPKDHYGRIAPRSSMFKKGILTEGTIDCGYTGPVMITLWNLSKDTYMISRGERIAQLIIQPYTRCALVEVPYLDETERGAGGFGSTGK